MSTARFGISCSKGAPNFKGTRRARDQWLESRRYSTNERAIYEAILSLPLGVGWIHRNLIISGEGCSRDGKRVVKVTNEIVPVKQGMDLQAPHQVIGGVKLGHTRHVNGKKVGGVGI